MSPQHDTPDWSILHSVEEMKRLSNLGHRIEGILLATVAVIALCEAGGLLKSKYIWPSIVMVAGLFLVGFLLLHHGLQNFKLVWSLISKDAQQRQHLIMAILLIVASAAQIISARYDIKWLGYVWPVVLGIIGAMFLIHEQHGSSEAVQWAQTIHKYLGVLLLIVAALIAVSLFYANIRWLLYAWPIALLVASVFLFIYKEPEGAYDNQMNHKEMNHEAH